VRVLLVSPQPFFELRGTPINVLNMCRALTSAGHEVHLATYPIGEDVFLDGLTVHRAARPPGIRSVKIGFSKAKIALDGTLAVTVARLALTRRFDVVHAVEESVFFCVPLRRLAGLPLIYDLDSVISDQLRYSGVVSSERLLSGVRRIETAALRSSDCVITVCAALSDFVRAEAPGVRVFQIEDPPMPGTDRAPREADVEAMRAELGLAGRQTVVYTGNLEPYQGAELLVDAAGSLVRRRADAVVLVVGGDPARQEELRRRAARMGAGETLRFLPPQPPDRMPEIMALSACLVSPRTAGQNTPMKIYTYMSSGRPIVATDLPTHTQVLDASTAVLVRPTADGLANGIEAILSDPAWASALGEAARERVERDYSFERFRERLAEVYAFIASRRGRRS